MSTIAKHFEIETGSGPLIAELPFSNAEYERRLAALRRQMAADGIDVFVSFGPENIFYLTGHDTPAYQYTQACVVTAESAPINVLRSIDASNTFQYSWSRRAVVYQDDDEPVLAISSLIGELAKPGTCVALESDAFFVTPRRYSELVKLLEANGYKTVAAHLVEKLRLIKSGEEIACIRKAALITEKAMAAAITSAAEGKTEDDVAAETWRILVGNGGQFPGLPPFISSGPRTSMAHATWAGRILRAGDPLAFEIPGVVSRYVAPLFRCGTVGKASQELKRLQQACVSSLERLVDSLKPGIKGDELHRVHVENFARLGLRVGHRSGYSIGVNYAPDWGEGNELSIMNGEKRTLMPGMTFHLVPGIFIPNVCAVVVSESVLVTEDGCEVITKFPRDLFSI